MKDTDETTPDELMEDFRGRSLKTIIVFTIAIHAVLLLGTSVPFLVKSVMGKDTSAMSEEERMEQAVKEATESLREIADQHGLNPRDISSQFAGGAPRPPGPATGTPKDPAPTPTPSPDPTAEPGDPKSTVEKELDVKADGPKVPTPEDDEEDLFK